MLALDPTNNAFSHPDTALYVLPTDGTGITWVNGSHDFKSQPESW
jgi:hypothetical protein